LLSDVLPIADEINPTSVRCYLHRVAERIDGELGDERLQFIEGCANEWAKQPPPGPPLTVGLDGGYVHASERRDTRKRQPRWGYPEKHLASRQVESLARQCAARLAKDR
jgi:hypothetical protein